MNRERRAKLKSVDVEALRVLLDAARSAVAEAKATLDEVKDEEDEARENRPESMHGDETDEQMQQNVDTLDEVVSECDSFDDAVETILDALSKIDEVE